MKLIVRTLMLCALALPALADSHGDHERAREALAQGKILPLRQVLEQVERQYQGQALKIEFEEDEGRYLYEIRLLQSDGRMAKLKIDAHTGEVLRIKRKER